MACLYDIRSVLIGLLVFAAFLNFDELAKLVRSGVELHSEVSGEVTCPVNVMNQYLNKAQISHDSPLF